MTTKKKPTFNKDSLVKSKRYKKQRDILNALLKSDKVYTLDEVDALIKSFLNKEVK